MPRYVAFLRAINVGGRTVKMDRLRSLFESAGLQQVSTFIASGNVIFESRKGPAALEPHVERALETGLGYPVATMIRSTDAVAAVLDTVDRLGLAPDGTMLYLGFLKSAPSAAAAKQVAAMSNDIDALQVRGAELYWQCRTRFSDSTVTPAKLEKALGVACTVRSVSSVRRLSTAIHT